MTEFRERYNRLKQLEVRGMQLIAFDIYQQTMVEFVFMHGRCNGDSTEGPRGFHDNHFLTENLRNRHILPMLK